MRKDVDNAFDLDEDELLRQAAKIAGGTDATTEERKGFMGMLKGLPNKLLNSCEAVYNNPRCRNLLIMQGKSIEAAAMMQIAQRLLETGWKVIDSATADMDDNKVVHYALRTTVGRTATTVILCQMMLQLFMFLEERSRLAGHEERATVCRKMSSLMAYIVAQQVSKAVSLDRLIDTAFDYIEALLAKADVKLDDIVLPEAVAA